MSPPALKTPLDGFVSVNGVRLHYVDWGGDGPPAVFHHATGFHARVWDPIARALCGRFRVYALDGRGHGDSEKPESGYAWPVFVSDLIGFLEALGIRGALGVGHSLGGTLVAGVAAERPAFFDRVVLIDPILFPREFAGVPMTENPMVAAARKRREVWPSREEMLASYRPRAPFDTWGEEALRLYVEHGTEIQADGSARLKCPGRIEAQVFSMSPAYDGWAVLERVAAPALVIRGEISMAFSERDAAGAVERLARAKLVCLPGTTHFTPMEKPEAIVAAIEDFLGEPHGAALPIRSRGLAHLALRVRDLEAERRFYERVFGMRVVWRPDPDNVYLSSGRDNLALHRADGTAGGRGALDHLGFVVESPAEVFAAAETLEREGVKLARPPRRHRDGSCSLYLEDPEGNVVQVLSLAGVG